MKNRVAVAVLVAASAVPAAAWTAEPMGRLFFTPEQRKALDAGKFASTQSAPVKPGPRTVRLDGVVTRSDADRTVWINGTAYHGGSPDGVQVKTSPSAPSSTTIRVPGKAAPARVKVGQRLDLNSGRVQEDLSREPAATESVAPAAEPVVPRVLAKKLKTSGEEVPPVREAAKPAGKTGEADSARGGDVPATAR